MFYFWQTLLITSYSCLFSVANEIFVSPRHADFFLFFFTKFCGFGFYSGSYLISIVFAILQVEISFYFIACGYTCIPGSALEKACFPHVFVTETCMIIQILYYFQNLHGICWPSCWTLCQYRTVSVTQTVTVLKTGGVSMSTLYFFTKQRLWWIF